MVKDHTLKKGKVKGSDPQKNERMATLVSDFRKEMTAYGAGDQLVCCVLVCVCICVVVLVQIVPIGRVGFFSTLTTRVHGRGNKCAHPVLLSGILFSIAFVSSPILAQTAKNCS